MKRAMLWLFGVAFILLLLLPLVGNSYLFRAALTCLPLGWLHFLQRNVPQLTWNWSLIDMVFVCSAILLFLGNRLLSALYVQIQKRGADRAGTPWRWRWTASLYIALWLVFITAFAAAGVFRHATWLMDEPDPWYKARVNANRELSVANNCLQMAMMEAEDNLEKTLSVLKSERAWGSRKRLLCEDFDFIIYANEDKKVQASVIIPRDPELQKEGKFSLNTADKEDILPIAKLQATLAELDAKYPVK